MRSHSFQVILTYFLSLTLLLTSIPLLVQASGESPAEAIPPETTSMSTESLPEDTPSESSIPEASADDNPQSEESTFEGPVPAESPSEETATEVSVPEASSPRESVPAESVSTPSIPETSLPPETPPEDILPATLSEPAEPAGPGLYFGLLGAHSDLSEGTGTVEDLFQSAANMPNLDFFAVTDHSDSFDNMDSADIRIDSTALSADWAAGKAAAAAVTSSSFAGLFGYEMNWPSQMKLGHISTFGTPGFQSRTQEPYRNNTGALENYYAALASVPGSVSCFNHPGTQYGSFNGFQPYCADADRAISLLELDFAANDSLRYYIQALDRGWHLAPTAGQSIYDAGWPDTGTRTAVQAQSLTEAGILEALKNCRAYATEDPDLEVAYSMDGHDTGSRLALRHTGDRADISVSIHDPTDGAACTVEIITAGGKTAVIQSLDSSSGRLSFSLPPVSGYYFLHITQPDGDRAVTAPIWLDAEEDLGIASLSCNTSVPTQQEPLSLTAVLHNGENVDFLVESLEVLADGNTVAEDSSLTRIRADSTLSHPFTFSLDCVGLTRITVRLSGTLEGSRRSFESSLEINLRQPEQISEVLTGNDQNSQPYSLEILSSMAADNNIRFRAGAELPADSFRNCRFLLITSPAQPFSSDFLAAASDFVSAGGSIVLCGQGDNSGRNEELNRLLSAIGSTLRITDQPVQDMENNDGDPSRINTDRIHHSLSWCEGISENQVYRAVSACAVDPGQGQWMVKARPTAGSGEDVLLACEELPGGGTVFAAGSLFLSDEDLAAPANLWEEPYANRSIAENLLGIGGEALPRSTIAQARTGNDGQLFRIQGYVTAGTSNAANTFPDTLYLQDDTGGVAVIPFPGGEIQPGTPIEVTGYAGTKNGNRILKLSSWKVLEGNLYQYPPLEGNWDSILDTVSNGGRLIQVEGICREIYCREDDTLAGCLLEDTHGNTAVIQIEDHIGGSDGNNDLHRTIRSYRTVRAIGLLHIDDYGNTVIRVRNCDEVVWVPPRYYWNPRTGDFLLPGCCTAMAVSALGLVLLKKRKAH